MPHPRHARIVAILTSDRRIASDSGAQMVEMLAYLTPDGRMDLANQRIEQPVRRLLDGRETWAGWLVSVEQGWALRSTNGEDTPLWFLKVDRLRPGEHVTIRSPDGDEQVFRVVNVTTMDD
jgi:hypothetical protein